MGQIYSDFVIQRVLRVHLPLRFDWSVIEIEDVQNLVDLRRIFGYEPFEAQCSHSGVPFTLTISRKDGFDIVNVIEAYFGLRVP